MKTNPNSHQGKSNTSKAENINRLLHTVVYLFSLIVTFLAGGWAWAQSAPFLTTTPIGTNQMLITITNAVSTSSYELWTTPVLANATDYPWTIAAVGSTGQTNFTVNIGTYPAGFYRVLLDTNTIPLWQAADPNNQGAGILTVFIDTPTNGASLQ